MDARAYGNLQTVPCATLAHRCAVAIMDYATARAVSLDPEGRVWVEAPADAAESDLVGCYTKSLGLLELTRRIRDDLAHEKGERGFKARRRHVVVRTASARKRQVA